MHDFNGDVLKPKGGTGNGNILKGFEDEPVDGLGAADRQAETVNAIDGADIRAAIDQKAAVVLRVDVARVDLRIGGEFADHFFEQILKRDQTFDIAIFVDHEGHALLLLLEVQQLHIEISGHRYVIGLDQQRTQIGDGEIVART